MTHAIQVEHHCNTLYLGQYGDEEGPKPLSVNELPVEKVYRITRNRNNKHTIVPQRVIDHSIETHDDQSIIQIFERLRQED